MSMMKKRNSNYAKGVSVLIVYISGAMSGIKDYNYPLFFQTEEELNKRGVKAINPARLGYVDEYSWNDYLRRDIKALMDADAILMLKGWGKSKGASLEKYIAEEIGMQVFYSIEEIK